MTLAPGHRTGVQAALTQPTTDSAHRRATGSRFQFLIYRQETSAFAISTARRISLRKVRGEQIEHLSDGNSFSCGNCLRIFGCCCFDFSRSALARPQHRAVRGRLSGSKATSLFQRASSGRRIIDFANFEGMTMALMGIIGVMALTFHRTGDGSLPCRRSFLP